MMYLNEFNIVILKEIKTLKESTGIIFFIVDYKCIGTWAKIDISNREKLNYIERIKL